MSPLSLIDVSSMHDRVRSIVGDDHASPQQTGMLRARDDIAVSVEAKDTRFALTGALFAGILISFGALAAAHVLFDSNGEPQETQHPR
jgi:hypothetical protein